jgi:hypothetical protein
VTPADDRLPVNALSQTDDDKSERIRNAFDKTFTELGYGTLWHSLRDWVSDSAAIPMSTEIIGETFNRDASPYTAKFGPISTLYEIRLIPEFPAIYKDIAEHLSVGEKEPKININFADNLTVISLIPEFEPYIDTIMSARAENPFTAKDAIYNLIQDSEAYTAALPFFDVKSSLFYVKIEVDVLNTVQIFHVLLRRNGKRFTVIRYIEGRDIRYF